MADDRPPRLWWGMWKRFLTGGALIVVLSAGTTATIGLETVSKVAANLAQGGVQIKSPALTADQAGAPQTILVIGSDKRARSTSSQDRLSPPHTDTILLVRMDPHKGQTSIMSIPRDLAVNISYRGGFYPNEKMNAAYSIGGAPLTVKVIKQTLGGITINHVVDMNFQAFRRVVEAIGCVYVDVDHRYYHSNAGLPPSLQYSEINIAPGYQKLCGQSGLDYVRYRHTDSDFARVARQQDFIRQVKEQIGVSGLINNYGQITAAVGKAIQTDIRGTTQVLRLIKLAAFSLGGPIRQVKFQVVNPDLRIGQGSFVGSSPELIRATVDDFLNGNQKVRLPASSTAARQVLHHHAAAPSAAALGLLPTPASDRGRAVTLATNTPVPVQMPTLKTGAGILSDAHAYAIRDERRHLHRGYRIDWQQTGLGGYYGVEGMDWTDPPLFAHARSETIAGRRYLLVDDGSHIHVIGWRTPHAVYWVSNTLLEDLSNAQLIAIARSVRSPH